MHPHDMRSTQYGGDDRRRVGNLQRRRGLCPRRLNEWPEARPAVSPAERFQAFPCRHRLHKGFPRTTHQEGQTEAAKAFEVGKDFVVLTTGLSEAETGIDDQL